MSQPTRLLMKSYEGRSIGEICANGYSDTGQGHNHCAHFVSHVMDYRFGRTCERMVARINRQVPGVTRSVKEIFLRSANKAILTDCTTFPKPCLLFVTPGSNIRERQGELRMGGSMTRHMGIAVGSQVWHYSNRQRKVKVQPASTFVNHFRGATVMVRGDLVPGRARFFGVSPRTGP